MENRALRIIKKDIRKAEVDSVFYMLYQMAREKFEKNILLPVLKEIEDDCIDSDKYDFYFKALIHIVYINKDIGGNLKYSGLNFSIRLSLTSFVYYHGILGLYSSKQRFLDADEKINKIFKNPTCDMALAYKDIIKDKELYEILKETWLGHVISNLSTLRERLEEKYAPITSDGDDFFDL